VLPPLNKNIDFTHYLFQNLNSLFNQVGFLLWGFDSPNRGRELLLEQMNPDHSDIKG